MYTSDEKSISSTILPLSHAKKGETYNMFHCQEEIMKIKGKCSTSLEQTFLLCTSDYPHVPPPAPTNKKISWESKVSKIRL